MIKDLISHLTARQGKSQLNVAECYIEEAIVIRLVEESFLNLFSKGLMNGTVHTCVGQEFAAIAVTGQLSDGDWVTSNHRCHGHFISKTKNWKGLVDELLGLESGVCRGIGSSQHLYADGFISNGPQGALLPVALGIALANKLDGRKNIVVSYIGEGTFGEGIVYECLNIAALKNLPFLLVCENNFYSQSTKQAEGLSGNISDRAKAFGFRIFEANTWELEDLFKIANAAIEYVRQGRPAFLLIQTYRLNAHSKGDDFRDKLEIEFFREIDPLAIFLKKDKWKNFSDNFQKELVDHINNSSKTVFPYSEYMVDQLPRSKTSRLVDVVYQSDVRMIHALNAAYEISLLNGAIHIGEDILDPYGGAFKVTKGLSDKYPNLVIGSPISEAAIAGIGIGLSFAGKQAYVEIMFGDFLSLCFDQLLNNASKFFHMYGLRKGAPVRIRTPMGGGRGYGPTHSQSIEKHFLGMDNLAVVALTSLCHPGDDVENMRNLPCPLLIIENKVEYGKHIWKADNDFGMQRELKPFGALRIFPKFRLPTLTIFSYGECARTVVDNIKDIFLQIDEVPEVICLVQLHPLDLGLLKRSVEKTRKLICIEAGSSNYGVGSEVLSQMLESGLQLDFVMRLGADPVPIPSPLELEKQVISSIEKIIKSIKFKKGFHDG